MCVCVCVCVCVGVCGGKWGSLIVELLSNYAVMRRRFDRPYCITSCAVGFIHVCHLMGNS